MLRQLLWFPYPGILRLFAALSQPKSPSARPLTICASEFSIIASIGGKYGP